MSGVLLNATLLNAVLASAKNRLDGRLAPDQTLTEHRPVLVPHLFGWRHHCDLAWRQHCLRGTVVRQGLCRKKRLLVVVGRVPATLEAQAGGGGLCPAVLFRRKCCSVLSCFVASVVLSFCRRSTGVGGGGGP